MSIYIMMALDLPKWMIDALEKLCRGFLWCGKEKASGGACPIAWAPVCSPKWLGGLGLRNLHLLNEAFRMKWLWHGRRDADKPWLLSSFPCSSSTKAVFATSTTMVVGNCNSSLFRSDRWIDGQSIDMIAPLVVANVDAKVRRTRLVADALVGNQWIHDLSFGLSVPAMAQYLALWHVLASVSLRVDVEDSLQWIWTASKSFSAKSAYLDFFEGSTRWPLFSPIWDCKAPLKFKLFAWKVAWDRCWTGVRRKNHGLTDVDTCPICLQEPETIEHLLVTCSFSRQIWFQVLLSLGRPKLAPSASSSLLEWWPMVVEGWTSLQSPKIKALALLVLRSIWLERNNRVFKGKVRAVRVLLDSLMEEADKWKVVGFL
ncbi:unnamed protein product [Alopecurus aequalis]